MDRQRLLLDTYTSAIYRQSLSKNITTASITVYVIIKIDVIILDRDAWKNRMPEIVQMTAKMDSVFRTRWFRTALFVWSPATSRITSVPTVRPEKTELVKGLRLSESAPSTNATDITKLMTVERVGFFSNRT